MPFVSLLPLSRSTENMPLKSGGDGCYTATWVPGTSGKYLIQIFIDDKHTGKVNTVPTVTPTVSLG